MAESLSTAGKKRLKKYIQHQVREGHQVSEVKDHLVSYGHSEREIEVLFEEILVSDEQKQRRTIQRIFEILFVTLFFVFVFWVSASSNSPGEAIFVGFLPTIIYIILTILIIDYKDNHANLLLLLPAGLNFLFYIAGSIGNVPILSSMEVGKLAFLNLIVSYIFLLAIYYSELFESMDLHELFEAGEHIEKPKQKTLTEVYEHAAGVPAHAPEDVIEITPHREEIGYVEVLAPAQEPLEKTIHSIEDKLKALNSVIGRVYRRTNGGTTLVRDLIKIKSEWYNEFNVLSKTQEKDKILSVLNKIEKRLNRLFRSEHDVFGKTKFKNLKRDSEGKTRIIDVLAQNDNDPVEVYLENALISCGRIRESLAKTF